MLEPQGRIKAFNLTANRQSIQLMGRELQENASFVDYVLEDMQAAWKDQFNRAKAGEQVHDELVYQIPTRSRILVWNEFQSGYG
jgi:hypothetical protein